MLKSTINKLIDGLLDGKELVNKDNGMKVWLSSDTSDNWKEVICKNIQGSNISTFPLSYLLNGDWKVTGADKKKVITKEVPVMEVEEEVKETEDGN